jgi:hypothetical protein
MLTVVLTDFSSVNIERYPARYETRWIKSSQTSLVPEVDHNRKICSACQVKWTFELKTELGYKVEEKEKFGNKWLVRLHIENAHIAMTLPIDVEVPASADERLKRHIVGHIDILKQVYDGGEKHVASAVRESMKRSYSGEGETVDEACAEAVRIATYEIAEAYQKNSNTVVQDIVEIYDLLQLKESAEPASSVEEAFRIYRSGGPRRLITITSFYGGATS